MNSLNFYFLIFGKFFLMLIVIVIVKSCTLFFKLNMLMMTPIYQCFI